MQPIGKNLPAMKPSQPSTAVSNSLQKPSAEQLAVARTSLKGLLKGRPDTNAENPQYLAEMVEVLSWLSPEEHGWLTHPRNGLQTVCKFLPTPADVHQFIRERRASLEAVRPAPTTYRKLDAVEKGPWDEETDYERKKRVVREKLGYNPDTSTQVKRAMSLPSDREISEIMANLKSPPAPPSEELKQQLRAKGYLKDQA